MRFSFVFDGLGYGGIERVGIDYCNELVRRGHEVTVVNLDTSRTEFVDQLLPDITYIEKDFRRGRAPERYCQLIKYGWWGRYLYPLVFVVLSIANKILSPLYRRKLPAVDVSIAFSGHFNDLTFVANKYVESHVSIGWMHGAISSYLLMSDGYINLYKKIRNLVCLVDEGNEEFFYANKHVNLTIRKIYNPIAIGNQSIDTAQVQQLREKYGSYLLMVARFSYPHKDQPTVIKALYALKHTYGLEPKLLFIGDGPDMNKSRRLAEGLGISSQVVFVGYKNNPLPYYAAASVVIHASVAGEGLPTAMLEAMSLGKPVVATDSKTGPREILGNNEYGLLCKIQDANEMAAHVFELLTDKEMYQRYSTQAYERVKDFSVDGAIDKLQLFAQALLEPTEIRTGER